MTATQGPDGVIHIATSKNTVNYEIELNEAWILAPDAAQSPEPEAIGPVTKHIEKWPNGKLKAEWGTAARATDAFCSKGRRRFTSKTACGNGPQISSSAARSATKSSIGPMVQEEWQKTYAADGQWTWQLFDAAGKQTAESHWRGKTLIDYNLTRQNNDGVALPCRCHPERRSPWRPKSKDLRLPFSGRKMKNEFSTGLPAMKRNCLQTLSFLLILAAAITPSCAQQEAGNSTGGAWLFIYFKEPGNQGIYFALSRDGYHYTPLNDGQPWVTPAQTGELMRDVFLTRGPDGLFHMVWTWNWRGNSLGYASSPDLLTWSAQKQIPIMADFSATNNVWAPETYWDARKINGSSSGRAP